MCESDVRKALATGVTHMSVYGLQIEDNTPFMRWYGTDPVQSELLSDAAAPMLERAHEILTDEGWEHYEISNFAKTSRHRSRHNGLS